MKKLICRIVKYLIDVLNEVFTWCHTHINAPTLLTAIVVPPDIDLTWTDNADNNTCFKIWRSDDGTNFILIDTIGDLENYTDTTAIPGQDYWYKAQACDDDGNTSDYSNTVATGIEFTDIHLGLLYNWYVTQGNIAPTGWHVPTDAEYATMEIALGGNLIAGGKMKETGFLYWDSPNTGADNSSGFYGRGVGRRTNGPFTVRNQFQYLWCSTEAFGFGKEQQLMHNSASSSIAGTSKFFGQSIRLIKDDAIDLGVVVDYDDNVYPTVTIGTQVWMAQNLIVKHYNDGTPIPEVIDDVTWTGLGTGAWCYPDNNPANM